MTTLSSIRNAAIEDAGAGGLTVYATKEDLPTSGLTAGDQAYVSANSRLYVSNGSGWYNIALINATPSLSIDPTGAISLSTTGETTTITLTATDSDNAVAGLTYSVESDGSFAGMASISQDSSVFTITPLSEDSATTAESTLTFKASDGINFGSGTRTLTLTFNVENSNYTTLLLKNEETTDNQVDASSNSYTITEVSDVTSTAFSPYHPGGYSTYFDGTGDYITVASTSDFGFGTNSDFTLEAWIYPTTTTGDRALFDFRTSANDTATFFIDTSTGKLAIWNGTKHGATGTVVSANEWHHVAFVRSGSTTTAYLDGSVDFTTSTSFDFSSAKPLGIGGAYYSAGSYFTGYFSDYRIISGTALYTSSFTPPTRRLTAVSGTVLLACHLPYLSDGSTSDHTLTIAGNTSTKRFGPFDYFSYAKADHGGSAYFDGTGDYLRTGRLLETNSTTFTIEGWVYYSAASISADIAAFFCDSNNLTGQVYGPSFGTNASQQLIFRWYNTPTSYTCTSSETVPYNIWTHIAAVVNSNSIQFYINGKAATMSGTTTYNGTNSTQIYATIGANDRGALTGYIADFRLTTSAVYTTDFTPPTAPLTAITNTEILTCTNKNDIWDASSGNLLTKAGDVTGGANSGTLKFGKTAVSFDGSGDSISFTAGYDDPLYNFGTHDWTLEGWFYIQTLSGGRNLFSFLRASANEATPHVYTQGTDLRYYVLGTDRISGSSALTVNTWHHIAATRSGNDHKLFVDGTQVGSTWTSAQTYVQGRPVLGDYHTSLGNLTGGTNLLHGYAQDFRITKGLARYTSNFTPPTAEFDG